MRGLFIVFEGITGSGKKTQINFLVEQLKKAGREVVTLSFPDFETEIARLTKRIELDAFTLSLLYAADRSRHQERIRSFLDKGNVVIADRYCYSNFAYQSAKGVPLDWLQEIEKNVVKPNIAIFLDVPISISMGRIQQMNIEDFTKREILNRLQRDRELLEKIRENYLLLAKTDSKTKWFVVDDSQDLGKTQELVWSIVSRELS
jgi:dTMP kinase